MNSRPFALLLALAVAAAAPTAATAQEGGKLPTAKEVVDKYVAAIGGKEALAKRQSARTKGTMSIPASGLKGTVEVLSARPDKLLVTIDLAGVGLTKTGYDGKVGWTTSPIMGPSLMEANQLDQIREQANFDSDLHDPERYKTMEVSGPVDFEGKKAYELKLDAKSGRVSTEYFDVESGLMIGSKSTESSALGDIEVVTQLEGYKKQGDLLLATKTIQKLSGIEISMEMTEFEFDKVDPKAFDLPEEIRALIDNKPN